LVNTYDRSDQNAQLRTPAALAPRIAGRRDDQQPPAISLYPWLRARLSACADAVIADLAAVWLHLTAAVVGGVARHAALTGIGVIIILMSVTLLARDDGISFLLVKSDENLRMR
jgi:hypothetical protein